MKSLILFCSILLVTTSATAQNNSISTRTSRDDSPSAQRPWGVSVNAGAFFNRGFGVGLHHDLSDQLRGSLTYTQMSVDSDDTPDNVIDGYNAEHKIKEAAARVDFFPLSAVDRPGWYVGAAAVYIDLKTDIDPIFSNQMRTATDEAFGGRIYTGYQFGFAPIIARIGVGYGKGGAYSSNLGGTNARIEDDFLFDAGLTFTF